MNKILVFVYGTLLEGFGNHAYFLQDKAIKLGEHTTEATFSMISLGGFPGVIPEGNTAIKGEVYEVPEQVFQHLDGLEGYRANAPESGLYNRQQIDTPYGKAWIYIFNNRGGRAFNDYIIKSGSWREYTANK